MMMRKILFVMAALLLSTSSAMAADDKDVEWVETSYDFGTVNADHGPVSHEYVFTNNADEPLTVMSASVSCGCTRPKYTSEPVKPGKKGKITVNFLPKGQKGYISKNVKVRYKVAGKKTRSVTLKITGNVIPD